MTIHFKYEKSQVVQALRYHFISRPEIKTMIIIVNAFAILSITLYALQKITPFAFLIGTTLWLVLMISFWFILPFLVYKRNETFKHSFSMSFDENDFSLIHQHGRKSWPWKSLSKFIESPHFFHLYFDPRSFLLVPKSGLKDSDEVQELRHILKDKVS